MEVRREVTVIFNKEDDPDLGWHEVPRAPWYRAEKSILPFRVVVSMYKGPGDLAMKVTHVRVTGHARTKGRTPDDPGKLTLNVRTEDYYGLSNPSSRREVLPEWVEHITQIAEMVRD